MVSFFFHYHKSKLKPLPDFPTKRHLYKIKVTLKYVMAYITLNKKHFFHNLDLISQQIADREKIAIVLKDNAYGHGLLEMARLAQEYGLVHAVVRTNAEATQITEYFQTILVLADSLALHPAPNSYQAINF